MTCWNHFFSFRIFYIFNSISAQHQSPVCFCFIRKLFYHVVVNICCSVKKITFTILICPIIKLCFPFIVLQRNCLPTTAVFAFTKTILFINDLQISFAHFTFVDHTAPPLCHIFFNIRIYFCSIYNLILIILLFYISYIKYKVTAHFFRNFHANYISEQFF